MGFFVTRDNNMNNNSSGAISLKVWYGPLSLAVLLSLLFGLVVYFIQKTPSYNIYVDGANLDDYEYAAVQKVVQDLGQVQFYQADILNIYQALEKLSWVDGVSVYRDWHTGVVVLVTPKKAVANFGSDKFLDAKGRVFYPANKQQLNDKNLVTLHSDVAHAKEVMQKMYQLNDWYAPLGLVAKDVILTPRETWLIRFDNGMRVTVDYENTDQKLYMLSQTLQDEVFAQKRTQIASVDLRYKNGFAVSWK